MRFLPPELDVPVIAVAENQGEYLTVYAGVAQVPGYGQAHVVRAQLDAEERAAVARGEDLYIGLLTFGGPMTPLLVHVGKGTMAAVLNVRTT